MFVVALSLNLVSIYSFKYSKSTSPSLSTLKLNANIFQRLLVTESDVWAKEISGNISVILKIVNELQGEYGSLTEQKVRDYLVDAKGKMYTQSFTANDYYDLVDLATPCSRSLYDASARPALIRKNAKIFIDNVYRSVCLFRMAQALVAENFSFSSYKDCLARLQQDSNKIRGSLESRWLQVTVKILEAFIKIEQQYNGQSVSHAMKKIVLDDILSTPGNGAYIIALLLCLAKATDLFARERIFSYAEVEFDMRGSIEEGIDNVYIELAEIKRGNKADDAADQLKVRSYIVAMSHFLCQESRHVHSYEATGFYYTKDILTSNAPRMINVQVFPSKSARPFKCTIAFRAGQGAP